jgi:hypothetical protein
MTAVITVYFNGSAVDVTDYVRSVSIRRGRSRELDRFSTGTASVVFNNEDRRFDPLHSAGPYFGKIRPRLRVTVVRDAISLFDGLIEDWNLDYDVSGKSDASISCVDGLALLAQTALDEFTNAQQTPSERIISVITRPEVAYPGATNFDPGFNILQDDLVAANTDTLSYLDKVVATDLGRLFVDGAGVLRYRDRTSGITSSPQVVFASVTDPYVIQLSTLSGAALWFDAAAPLPLIIGTDVIVPFSEVAVELGSEFLFNRIQITRAGGVVQIAVDDDSVATYGVRTYSADGLLFLGDSETLEFADFLSTLYSQPDVRIAGHTVLLHGLSTSQREGMQQLEIGDVVRTIWEPNNVGQPIDALSLVEGIEHSIGVDTHTLKVQLTPFSAAGFILDDLNRGLLDTSELTY